jgi:O-antigen/teichoic acid export membrane protein
VPRGIRERVIFGLGWSTAGRFAALLGSLATNVLIARLLAPSDVGAYFLIVALTSVLALVSLLGLNQAVVRLVPEALTLNRPAEARRTIWLSVAVGGVSSCLFGLVLLLVGHWLALHLFSSPPMAGATVLVALLVPLTAVRLLIPEAFRGLHDLRQASIFGDGATNVTLAVALGVLFVVSAHASLWGVLTAAVVTGAGLVALSVGRLAVAVARLPRGGERPLGPMLRIALPMLAANLSWIVLAQIDMLILGAFRPTADVAYYGAADRVANLLLIPVLITNAVVAPFIAELWFGNRRPELQRLLRAAATACGVLSGAGLVVLAVGAGPILGLLFGDFYRRGAAVLIALAIGAFVNSVTGPSALVLLMTGQQVPAMVLTASVTAITTLVVVWAAGAYGALGVAIAMTVGVAAQNVGTLLLAKHRLGIWTLPSLEVVPAAMRRLT